MYCTTIITKFSSIKDNSCPGLDCGASKGRVYSPQTVTKRSSITDNPCPELDCGAPRGTCMLTTDSGGQLTGEAECICNDGFCGDTCQPCKSFPQCICIDGFCDVTCQPCKSFPLCICNNGVCGDTWGAFNNVAASLAASLDRSSSIERILRKARLAKMASVAKVF